MECEFTEKISRLVDDELEGAEAEAALRHLETCASCRDARADFLRLRSRVKSYPYGPDHAAQRRALLRILGPARPPLWKRRVQLPAPAFALLLIIMVALVAWTALVRRGASQPPAAADEKSARIVKPASPAREGIDLARFDRGERAAIYKVKRAAGTGVEGRQ